MKQPRAIGYIRVSTGQQAKEGASVDMQHSIISEMAARDGAQLIDILSDEGLSGRKNLHKRTGYLELVSLIERKQIDIVYSYSLSRLGRKTAEIMRFFELAAKNNVSVVLYKDNINTSTAVGKLLLGVLAVVSEFEADLASERTTDVARNNKKEYKPYCNPPYGWAIEGRITDNGKVVSRGQLVEVPSEQETLTWILEKRKQKKSLSWIAKELNFNGIPPKRGKTWSHGQVASVIETSKSFYEMVAQN
jgi:DNA invertase Pin-like site-specific DNA recombinase